MPVVIVTLAVGLFLMTWLPGDCLKKYLQKHNQDKDKEQS